MLADPYRAPTVPPPPMVPDRDYDWCVLVGLCITLLLSLVGAAAVGVVGQLGPHPVSETLSQMNTIEGDLALYAAKRKGRYPKAAEGLEAAAQYFPDGKVPVDAWGNEFLYVVSAEGPLLISLGGDGAPGGEGADGDLIRRIGRGGQRETWP